MSDLGAGIRAEEVEGEAPRSARLRKERPAAAPDQGVELHDECTIGAVIRDHAELRPEHPAIVASQFAPLSYRELQYQIDEIGTCLRRAGFDRSARIAVAFPSGAQAALAIVAISCSAVAVPLDPKLTFVEVDRCFTILRPNAVIVLHGCSSAARNVAEQRELTIIEADVRQDGKLGLRLVAPQSGSVASLDDPDPDAPAFILHTSGTTADPNLVPFSHRNTLASANRLKVWFKLTPQDRCLNVGPIYYSHALTTTVMPPLITGGSVAFPADASKLDLLEWLGALGPTWYSAGPTLHLSVLDKAKLRPDARTMHSLRFISSAGAPLAKDAYEDLQRVLGIPVLEHYGSSETAQVSTNLPPPGPSKRGTCGIPWPDIISIVGEDGCRLSPGEQGEILVRGPTVTSGYLNAPDLNRSTFFDGWYRTGDSGSLDEEGFLSLHGRKKELINRGSEKIAPLEIDRALMRHPEVAEAAAYAMPHPRLGEDVAAAVVLHAGSNVTPFELREFLSSELATFKIPRRIAIVDQLPKGITGKVQRKRLNENSMEKSEQSAPSDNTWHANLLQLWKKFLKTEDVTIDDDFYEKGGDSIVWIDLHMELERLTGQTLPGSILFEASTVRELAKRLSELGLRPKPLDQSTRGRQSLLMFFHGDRAQRGFFARHLARALEVILSYRQQPR